MKDPRDCIAIYSRKSKFTGKGESIGNQVELCREYIRAAYGSQAAENASIFEDEGFSGGNLNRPDFKKMMTAARAKKFKAIVVYRLDRISRNISDFSALIEELSRLDIAFISIREQFDTGSPMGRAMMYIASVFSQLERETIAERIRDNMHELAKTGRWLGGTTPTGYTSESVKSITIDGKSKKACKLKLIPEEAEIVKKVYSLYVETDSLTLTEAELLRQRIKTKTGRSFTRFSIKGILQNPVYLIADENAYDYFMEREADVFSARSDFDGTHGILAYNRTDQEKGKTTVYLPIREWIVSVGQHPGIIPSRTWISVQESLERNRSKSYHKPRSNEALLTGLLYCRCGSRMYPKLSSRKAADGKPSYAYVCKMKERSQRSVCDLRNANGNALDTAVIAQVRTLSEDRPAFVHQLEQHRKLYTNSREEYEAKAAGLRAEQAENEKKITALVDSLAEFGDSTARAHVAKRVDGLHRINEDLTARITELEGLASRHALSETEFDSRRQLLAVLKDSTDDMSIEQERAAIRTVVRKVVWDGTCAHVILFGAPEEEIGSAGACGLPKTHWGEDSK